MTQQGVARLGRNVPQEGRPLTARETEVIERIAAGDSRAEVAARLYISAKTVDSHCASIFNKFGARTAAHAVALYLRGAK